jgi:hypothetical protein
MRVAGQGLLDHYVSQQLSENFAHQFVGLVMLVPAFVLILAVGWILDQVFIEESDDAGGAAPTVLRRSPGGPPPPPPQQKQQQTSLPPQTVRAIPASVRSPLRRPPGTQSKEKPK